MYTVSHKKWNENALHKLSNKTVLETTILDHYSV